LKYAFTLLALGCLVTAGAQQWQVELVDSSCTPTDVCVRRDSILTYVAYVAGVATIRIATKDTIWHYETLDTSLVHADFHFALGAGGRMAVSGVDDSFRPVVVEKLDSVWSRIWTREDRGMAMAVYGSDSAPAVIYGAIEDMVRAYVIVETRVDSLWQVDTAARFEPQTQFVTLSLYDVDGSPEAGPCFLIVYTHGLPKCGQSPTSVEVYKGHRSEGGWSLVGLGGGTDAVVYGYDIVAGGSETASAAVYANSYTRFDQDPAWAGRVTDAAVQVDSAGRELMAFVTSDGVLRFAFKTGFWHFCEIPGVTTATCCDLALDAYGQPLIAFEDGNGLSLAHGIDVVGAKEMPSAEVRAPSGGPTILSGAAVGRLVSSVVFDAMGRRAVNPKPGVYFVRDQHAQAQAQAVRKVIVQN